MEWIGVWYVCAENDKGTEHTMTVLISGSKDAYTDPHTSAAATQHRFCHVFVFPELEERVLRNYINGLLMVHKATTAAE